VELVVVVIIIGVLATASVTSMSQLDARKFKTEQQLILADLSLAREMAATRRKNYSVNFNSSANHYALCNAACACCSADGCSMGCSCCERDLPQKPRQLESQLNSAPIWVLFSAPQGKMSAYSSAPISLSRQPLAQYPQSPVANIVLSANTGYFYVE
jgi:type II secretory pathway pseudopilin PulG